MPPEIYTAIASVLTAVMGAATTYAVNRRKIKKVKGELTQAENFLNAEARAMKFEHIFATSASVRDQFQRLCEETEIDRIMLLIAWNGTTHPRWTKAIYQFRHGEQEVVEYIHTELDDDYRSRLQECKNSNHGRLFRVEQMPEKSLIGRIYRAEDVKSSAWFFLRESEYAEGNCYSYFSFATHETETISPDVMIRIQLIVDQIKASALDRKPQ